LVSSRRVLIVEDFKDLSKLVAFYLGAHGYQVLEAANGKAAIKTATSGKPHLILLDFQLPYMNGPDVVRDCADCRSRSTYLLSDGAVILDQTHSKKRYGRQAFIITSRSRPVSKNSTRQLSDCCRSQRSSIKLVSPVPFA